MADKIKKFFAKKKMEAKFKMAGPGHRLSETSSAKSRDSVVPSAARSEADVCEESRVAAEAALARLSQRRENPAFNTSLAAVQSQVRKELENEKMKEAGGSELTVTTASDRDIETPKNMATSGVYFKCPMISNEVLPREEWKAKVKEFLYEQLEGERGLTACLMIHSCNSNREKVQACVETLCKYLENIVTYPEEEKYRRIRMSNRVFTERVLPMEGAMELLHASGFLQQTLLNPEGSEEQYLVFNEDITSVESLVALIDALRTAEPIQPELERSPRVLLPSQALAYCHLPPAFYNVTPEELKREQLNRAEAVERSQMLRTKAMREKEEQREMRRYKYALVRVRFPDGILLQGTFSVYERHSDVVQLVRENLEHGELPFVPGTFSVYERHSDVVQFVRENLEHGELPFVLVTPTGHRLRDEDGARTLLELRLVPTCVLTFAWDESVEQQVRGSPNRDVYLKPEVMILVQEI